MLVKGLLISLIVKCFVSLFGYSGQGKPPMFGDYEAQRHWMEITYNLKISEWYFDGPNNNLTYWGLDYPPLTAYHSLLLGSVADFVDPSFIRLNSSRGYESFNHKVFMRCTVILSDLFTYTLGAVLFVKFACNRLKNRSLIVKKSLSQALLYVILFYPGLILIDNGHFQYNCVSIGLVLLSAFCLTTDRNVLSSLFYCLSFSYKQMSLYYSFTYFVYFLGKFVKESEKSLTIAIKNLFKIASTVLLTVFISWLPFVASSHQFVQVLHRIFPFYRGIFEDKVANFWCVANVLYKFKNVDTDRMALLCTIIVILTTLVSCVDLLLNPDKDKFLYSLLNSSLAFFLFSFQVHEKSILLVGLPATIIVIFKPLHCFWFLLISVFSMTPLLIKDNLLTPLVVLTLLYIYIFYYFYPIFSRKALIRELTDSKNKIYHVYYYLYLSSMIGCVLISSFSLIVPPPSKYPDIFPLLISCYSAMHFIYFLLFFNVSQLLLRSRTSLGKSKKRS